MTDAVSANAGTVGRRSAVIAASSGLVLTMGLPAADAAPVNDAPETPEAPAEATPEPVQVAQVAVPADATVTLAGSAFTSVTPPPPPPEPVVVERESDQSASRSSDRETVEIAPSEAGGSIMEIAARYAGTPYVYGGSSPSGFDCSGYVQYVFQQVGISLARTASAQSQSGQRVSRSEARPGDLVFFTDGGGVYHNAIYAGDGRLWDSPRSGKTVSKRAIWTTSVFFTRVAG
ncbi:MAG TPA: NlpC/P60 family protein [Actinomycetales bacterium]|nr:NlpC/P60 family protein [Actinomycetales bacterium]